MNKILVFLISFLCASSLDAQLLTNSQGEVYTHDPFFSRSFIKSKQLKCIAGRYSYKKPGKPFEGTDYWQVWNFDTLGRLISSYETKKDDGSYDTVRHKYFYNSSGLLINHRYGDQFSWNYESTMYDSLNRKSLIEVFRQAYDNDGILHTSLLKRESFEYVDNETKIVLNSVGIPYKKETITYDEEGNVTKREERFITTNQGYIREYEYQSKGILSLQTFKATGDVVPKEKETYLYDEHGNIKEKKIYSNEVFIKEFQFIFNEESQLLTAVLEQEAGSNFISILRVVEYEYYVNGI
jgi:hypothetical protein